MFDDVPGFELLRWIVLLSSVCIAVVTDVRSLRIPNWLTFPLVLTGIVAMTLHGGWGWDGFLDSILALVVVSLPFLITYVMGGGGAGDVKMMMGVGAWSGLDLGLYLLGGVIVSGLVLMVVYGLATRQLKSIGYGAFVELFKLMSYKTVIGGQETRTSAPEGGESQNMDGKRKPMPYALAIASGVFLGGIAWWIYS